jgi:peptide deformylase
MIRPILSFGSGLLRKDCPEIPPTFPNLAGIIDDMWDTMYNANGCGLAASQIGVPIRLFIVDSKPTFKNLSAKDREVTFEKGDEGITETFINPTITSSSENTWVEEEGCLSIPGVSVPVERPWSVTIEYLDRDFNKQVQTFGGATARMIQHELDHTRGKLYLDYLKPLRKKLIDARLKKISKGVFKTKYPMALVK